nr:hypothetical protein [Gluconacetobacter azotocaptans]
MLLSCCLFPVGAMAQDDGGGGGGEGGDGQGGSRTASIQLQKDLAVLQGNPDAASQDCLDALKELHKTQDMVAAEEARTKDQDLEVARDVLETDFETAAQVCTPDAASLCDKSGASPTPAMAKACAALQTASHDPRGDDEDDETGGAGSGGHHRPHHGGPDDGS